MDLEQKLNKRFRQAIKKSLSKCPLIGDNWFRYNQDAEPALFQFFGVSKLSKATGLNNASILKRIMTHLDVEDLDCEVEILDDGEIRVHHKSAVRAGSEAAEDE